MVTDIKVRLEVELGAQNRQTCRLGRYSAALNLPLEAPQQAKAEQTLATQSSTSRICREVPPQVEI